MNVGKTDDPDSQRGRFVHRHLAGIVASERQLSGIIDLDDRFQAASSAERLSRLDPLLPVELGKS